MNGYLSRLAQQTGLSFPAAPQRSTPASPPPAWSPAERTATPAPPHLDVVTFTDAQRTAPAEGFHEHAASAQADVRATAPAENETAQLIDELTRQAVEAEQAGRGTPAPEIARRTITEAQLRTAFEREQLQRSNADEQQVGARDLHTRAGLDNRAAHGAQRDDPPATRAESTFAAERTHTPDASARDAARTSTEISARDERVDEAATARALTTSDLGRGSAQLEDYLSEIRRWVTEPARDARAVEAQALEDARRSGRDAAFERAAQSVGNARGGSEEGVSPVAEAQDFELSIGSISIVVEEPAGHVAAQTVQPERAATSRAERADVGSRLRRRYIRF
ncbi:MAG TPA: hypothetical protein VE775_03325 [Pyrinomonadaceae bacterium]|nr:hypothetical protein [Pyrinomonadaceae bacterium]